MKLPIRNNILFEKGIPTLFTKQNFRKNTGPT